MVYIDSKLLKSWHFQYQIDSNDEEIFYPCYIYWNFALDTESSLILIIGYFHDNDDWNDLVGVK